MASRTALLITATMAIIVVGTLLLTTVSAVVYRVGDNSGWDVGVDYKTWASGKEFKVNDTLQFVYSSFHRVLLVGAEDFEACNWMLTNAPFLQSGDDSVVLDEAGQFFFICPNEHYCQAGMKLAVKVQ